jgi:glycosyltransferase involved in cell wall biosynthesis
MKPIVLIFTGYYLPGYKSGGILRNVLNTIDNLAEYCEFRIITRDRDLGDKKPYDGLNVGDWMSVGNAQVFYLSERQVTLRKLYKILSASSPDSIFLTSFFDPLTVKVLLIRLFFRHKFKRVIVAPFGEFAWASFRQKIVKKIIYVGCARLINLYKGVIWRVSSQFESEGLLRVMSPPENLIMVTGDLPVSEDLINQIPMRREPKSVNVATSLRIIFLSRISPEKNLDLALRILSKVKTNLIFDIYGPIENTSCWRECQTIIQKLPSNIKSAYCGLVPPEMIMATFAAYDLFLFPTGGEAYGNVIAESLSVGTPVLTSQNTPWRNLEADSLGWDLDLADVMAFVNIIEHEASKVEACRETQRRQVRRAARARLFNPEVLNSNLRLFGLLC